MSYQERTKILPGNCWSQKAITPTHIIWHDMSAINTAPDNPFDLDENWQILADYGVSAHMLVGRTKEEGILHCVPMHPHVCKAYHAGKSEHNGLTNFNNFSIGIEMIGVRESGGPTDWQYDFGNWITDYYQTKFNIPDENVLGHEQIARGRKSDPGIGLGVFDMSKILQKDPWG